MNDKISKLLNRGLYLSISILLILLSYMSLIQKPSGYILDIYLFYPISFWIGLFLLYFLILIFGYFNNQKKFIFILSLIIFTLIILLIPSEYVLIHPAIVM